MNIDRIIKYNVLGLKYTSYPTVPYLNYEAIEYKNSIRYFKQSFIESNTKEGICLYISHYFKL